MIEGLLISVCDATALFGVVYASHLGYRGPLLRRIIFLAYSVQPRSTLFTLNRILLNRSLLNSYLLNPSYMRSVLVAIHLTRPMC